MTKPLYVQDDLPNFQKALAEAREKGLDALSHLSKEYIHFSKMLQKCRDPEKVTLIQRQRQKMIDSLAKTR